MIGDDDVSKTGEDWIALCEQAAVEQDPERLMKLVQRIVELLDSRQATIRSQHAGSSND